MANSVERFCDWGGRHSDVDWDKVNFDDTSKRSGNSLVDTDAELVGLLQADSTLQHMSAPIPALKRGSGQIKSGLENVWRLPTYSVVAATALRLIRTSGFKERILGNGR